MRSPIPLLIRMKNNNPGFLSSRGDNFLFKNIYFLKSEKKTQSWKKLKFQFSKFWRFFGDFWDLLDFPLRFLYKRKGKSSKSEELKKNENHFFHHFQNFRILSDFKTFFYENLGNYPLSSLERRDYCFSCGLVAELCWDYFSLTFRYLRWESSKVLCAPDHMYITMYF